MVPLRTLAGYVWNQLGTEQKLIKTWSFCILENVNVAGGMSQSTNLEGSQQYLDCLVECLNPEISTGGWITAEYFGSELYHLIEEKKLIALSNPT